MGDMPNLPIPNFEGLLRLCVNMEVRGVVFSPELQSIIVALDEEELDHFITWLQDLRNIRKLQQENELMRDWMGRSSEERAQVLRQVLQDQQGDQQTWPEAFLHPEAPRVQEDDQPSAAPSQKRLRRTGPEAR